MALLTEQPISNLAEWLVYDSKLAILSAQESASIEKKGEFAQREVQTEILAFLLRNTGLGEAECRRILPKIHVSEPLRRWHASFTLALYYADMASLQASALHRENSRYYETRSEEARDQTFVIGLGIVDQAVPRGVVPQISWVGEVDENRLVRGRVRLQDANGVEGTASDEFAVPLTLAGSTTLTIPSLPLGAHAWQLYLAEDSDIFQAFTEAPIAGTGEVLLGTQLVLAGPTLSAAEQEPNRYLFHERRRGI
ncbi:MAG: hypothetical protein OHK0021_13040 [Bryobacter sp.]